MSAMTLSEDDWLDAEARAVLARRSVAPALRAAEMADNNCMSDPLDRPIGQFVRPFVWREPAAMPRRQWLYGRHLIRRFVSATFAPGGVGKSGLVLAEAMAMASGKPLLGHRPRRRLRVAYWNGEDPFEESERRVLAACLLHDLGPDDLEGWLHLGSGREDDLIIAEQSAAGAVILAPNVEVVLDTIRTLGLDVVIIDPFVSSHRVSENDNSAIDLVAKRWGKIADLTNTAIELVHHTRKTNGTETTVEDGRGAVALLNAARSARVLNVMSKDERDRAGVKATESYFRVEIGKANLAPPAEGAEWFQVTSVDLGNGDDREPADNVGAVRTWQWPDPFDGVSASHLRAVQNLIAGGQWRESAQASGWAGKAVAEALNLDLDDKADKRKVKGLLAKWLEGGSLIRVMSPDKTRQNRPMIEVGTWAEVDPQHQCTTLHHNADSAGVRPICNTAPPAPPPLGRCSGGGAASQPRGDRDAETRALSRTSGPVAPPGGEGGEKFVPAMPATGAGAAFSQIARFNVGSLLPDADGG